MPSSSKGHKKKNIKKQEEILKKIGIKPDEPVLLITAEEALENILEAIEEYCPHLRIDIITKKDLETLHRTLDLFNIWHKIIYWED